MTTGHPSKFSENMASPTDSTLKAADAEEASGSEPANTSGGQVNGGDDKPADDSGWYSEDEHLCSLDPSNTCRCRECKKLSRTIRRPLDMIDYDSLSTVDKIRARLSGRVFPDPVSTKFLKKVDSCKRDVLTSERWAPHRKFIAQALEEVHIENLVVLAISGYHASTSHAHHEDVEELEVTIEQWFFEVGWMLAIEEMVRTKQGDSERLPIVIQDPSLDDVDKRIFKALGGQVVEHPEAAKRIGAATFVFAMALPMVTAFKIVYSLSPGPGIILGSSPYFCLRPEAAYMIRAEYRYKGKDDSKLMETMFKFLQARKCENLPAMERPGPSRTSNVASHTGFATREYKLLWRGPDDGEHLSKDDILAEVKLLNEEEIVRTALWQAQMECLEQNDPSLDDDDVPPPTQEDFAAVRMFYSALSRSYDLNMQNIETYEWDASGHPTVPAEFMKELEHFKQELYTHEEWANYRALIADVVDKTTVPITTAVIFKLWDFHMKALNCMTSFASWFVHMAGLLALIETLEKKQGTKIKIVLVDDGHRDTTCHIMEALGAKVVDDRYWKPKDDVGPNTLVMFKGGLADFIKCAGEVLSNRPAMYTGARAEWLIAAGAKDTTSSGVRVQDVVVDFIKSHDFKPLPDQNANYTKQYIKHLGLEESNEHDSKHEGTYGGDTFIYYPAPATSGDKHLDIAALTEEFSKVKFDKEVEAQASDDDEDGSSFWREDRRPGRKEKARKRKPMSKRPLRKMPKKKQLFFDRPLNKKFGVLIR